MRRLTATMVLAAGLAAVAFMSAAFAAPTMPNLNQQQISNIVPIAQGCGAGFHRNYYGRCVPNRYYEPYGPRGCGPGFHRNYYGRCVPNRYY